MLEILFVNPLLFVVLLFLLITLGIVLGLYLQDRIPRTYYHSFVPLLKK